MKNYLPIHCYKHQLNSFFFFKLNLYMIYSITIITSNIKNISMIINCVNNLFRFKNFNIIYHSNNIKYFLSHLKNSFIKIKENLSNLNITLFYPINKFIIDHIV